MPAPARVNFTKSRRRQRKSQSHNDEQAQGLGIQITKAASMPPGDARQLKSAGKPGQSSQRCHAQREGSARSGFDSFVTKFSATKYSNGNAADCNLLVAKRVYKTPLAAASAYEAYPPDASGRTREREGRDAEACPRQDVQPASSKSLFGNTVSE